MTLVLLLSFEALCEAYIGTVGAEECRDQEELGLLRV